MIARMQFATGSASMMLSIAALRFSVKLFFDDDLLGRIDAVDLQYLVCDRDRGCEQKQQSLLGTLQPAPYRLRTALEQKNRIGAMPRHRS
jgi:hypothetical protein